MGEFTASNPVYDSSKNTLTCDFKAKCTSTTPLTIRSKFFQIEVLRNKKKIIYNSETSGCTVSLLQTGYSLQKDSELNTKMTLTGITLEEGDIISVMYFPRLEGSISGNDQGYIDIHTTWKTIYKNGTLSGSVSSSASSSSNSSKPGSSSSSASSSKPSSSTASSSSSMSSSTSSSASSSKPSSSSSSASSSESSGSETLYPVGAFGEKLTLMGEFRTSNPVYDSKTNTLTCDFRAKCTSQTLLPIRSKFFQIEVLRNKKRIIYNSETSGCTVSLLQDNYYLQKDSELSTKITLTGITLEEGDIVFVMYFPRMESPIDDNDPVGIDIHPTWKAIYKGGKLV